MGGERESINKQSAKWSSATGFVAVFTIRQPIRSSGLSQPVERQTPMRRGND